MYQLNTGPRFTPITSLSFNSLFYMWQVFATFFKQSFFSRNLLICELIFEVALPKNGLLAKRNTSTDQILIDSLPYMYSSTGIADELSSVEEADATVTVCLKRRRRRMTAC